MIGAKGTAALGGPELCYRYLLTRRWGRGPSLTFIMLNPSTADSQNDDSTIRRCLGYAKREGYNALSVLNLFAFRARDPSELLTAPDPIGPENAAYLKAEAKRKDGITIAAWGSHPIASEVSLGVRGLFIKYHRPLYHLGLTKSGQPKHPLYLSLSAPLEPL